MRRFGSQVFQKPHVHPPPSFWSSSVAYRDPNSPAIDPSPAARRGTVEPRYRVEGSATADTVCSAQRALEVHLQHRQQLRQQRKQGQQRYRRRERELLRRSRSFAAGESKATDPAAESSLRGADDREVRTRRGHRAPTPELRRPLSAPRRAQKKSRPDLPASDGRGRFRPEPTEAWPDLSQDFFADELQKASGGTGKQDDSPPTRVLRWAWEAEDDETEEEKSLTISPMHGSQLPTTRLAEEKCASPSARRPRRATNNAASAGEGETFLEIQRDLLARLEALFVTVADERRHALRGIKREEASWRAAAAERARSDLRAERAELEERVRERVVQEGPGARAREAVGLVRGDEGEGKPMGASPTDATRRVPPDGASPEPQGPQRRWPTGWRLPKSVLDDMRRDLRCEMDRETAEVLGEENKSIMDARTDVAGREETRTQCELQELDERLANDGRDALADLRRELEDEAEARLEAERRRLKDEMSGALRRERERLAMERGVRMTDARSTARRETAESAADLRDQAARSTGERRDEAVKVLDQAAARARDDLQALLRAQEAKALEELRTRHSAERKAAVERVRREEGRQSVEEVDALAQGAREENEAWLRKARRDLREVLAEGEGNTAPGLQLRAVEAVDECGRICRRLVDMMTKEAILMLQDSGASIGDARDQAARNGSSADVEGRHHASGVGSDEHCADCERLLHASVELKRVMLERATANAERARAGKIGTLEAPRRAAGAATSRSRRKR